MITGQNMTARAAGGRYHTATAEYPATFPQGALTDINRALRERDQRLGVPQVRNGKGSTSHLRERRKLADPLDKVKGPW